MTITAAQLVASAKARIECLDPERFAERTRSTDAVLVDLREADERVRGTIPGAVHVPRGMLEFRADPTSPFHDPRFERDRPVLLHCEDGDRSALAARVLGDLGFTDVAHLDGGMAAWRGAGRAVVNDFKPPY